MVKLKEAGMTAFLAFALAVGSSAGATSNAAPAARIAADVNAAPTLLQKAEFRNGHGRNDRDREWRRRYWGHNHHYYRDDIEPGAFIALGILGALVQSGISEDQARTDMDRCAEQFRSFEWDTGLYTTYDGERRLCPYLG